MEIVRIFSIDIKCCIFFISTFFVLSSNCSKQYRTDYVYNSETDAFYKFHKEEILNKYAQAVCAAEGATLMVPSSAEDVSQALKLYSQYPDVRGLAWIGLGGQVKREETPPTNFVERLRWTRETRIYCAILDRTGKTQTFGCNHNMPFVCKVDAKDVIYDKQCKVFGKGYRYFENVGSCYKIPEQGFEWNKAYAECRAEGAHLAVLNSELEQQVIYNITNEEHRVSKARVSWLFFAGIRAEKKTDGSPILFKTIFNQTLEEAGFSQWTENSSGNEHCGSIYNVDGKYNSIDCTDKLGFICEKEVMN